MPFDDFMADEFCVAERVYGLVGEPVTDDARTAMSEYWPATSEADSAGW